MDDIVSISCETALAWIAQDLTEENIGSGNGLVPSGNKAIPEPVKPYFNDSTAHTTFSMTV